MLQRTQDHRLNMLVPKGTSSCVSSQSKGIHVLEKKIPLELQREDADKSHMESGTGGGALQSVSELVSSMTEYWLRASSKGVIVPSGFSPIGLSNSSLEKR